MDYAPGAPPLHLRPLPEVDVFEHEVPQLVGGSTHLLAHVDTWRPPGGHATAGRPGSVNDVTDQGVDALGMGRAEHLADPAGKVLLSQEAGADRVGDVVGEGGHGIGQAD